MMRGELLCWDGRRIRLPDAVEWRFQYGCGTPCDSFQITCLWEPDSGNDLAEAVSFTAEENGERLFTGVVDECERGWDTAGGTLTVAGRGMAARLLDNEALGADYQVATVEDILRDHVAPYGIEIVRGAELPPVPARGSSASMAAWNVRWLTLSGSALTNMTPSICPSRTICAIRASTSRAASLIWERVPSFSRCSSPSFQVNSLAGLSGPAVSRLEDASIYCTAATCIWAAPVCRRISFIMPWMSLPPCLKRLPPLLPINAIFFMHFPPLLLYQGKLLTT